MRLWLLTVDELCQDKVRRKKQCRLAVGQLEQSVVQQSCPIPWACPPLNRRYPAEFISLFFNHCLLYINNCLTFFPLVSILLNSSHCSSITVCYISTIVSHSFLSCPAWDLYCPLSFLPRKRQLSSSWTQKFSKSASSGWCRECRLPVYNQ